MMLEILNKVKHLYIEKVKIIESEEFRKGYAKCYNVFKDLFLSTDQVKLELENQKLVELIRKKDFLLQNNMYIEWEMNLKITEALALVKSTEKRDVRRAVRWKIHYVLKDTDKSSLDKVKELTELTNNWNE